MGLGNILGGIGSIAGGIFGAGANRSAAGQMSQGQLMAALAQQQMFAQVQQSLSPFMRYGQNAYEALAPLIGANPGGNPLTAPLTKMFNPTMEDLEKTPGYQFTLGQGLKTLDNKFASKGLGLSGNALRGAADYTTGLASTTYQQNFDNYWNQNKNIYGMLSGMGNVGLSAAQSLAGSAGQFGQMIGNDLIGAGNAQAGGTMGAYNSLMNGIGGAYGLLGNGLNQYGLRSLGGSLMRGLGVSPFPSGNYSDFWGNSNA